MILAQKQTHRSTEWNRGSRNRPTNVWPNVCFVSSTKQKRIPNGKMSLQQMVLGKLDSYMQKNEPGPLLIPYTKINLKWMKNLNVTQEAITILEEKTGNNLFDLSHSNFLFNMSPKAREIKAKMNYWDLIKIKLLHSKGTIHKTQRQPTEWEKIFTN